MSTLSSGIYNITSASQASGFSSICVTNQSTATSSKLSERDDPSGNIQSDDPNAQNGRVLNNGELPF